MSEQSGVNNRSSDSPAYEPLEEMLPWAQWPFDPRCRARRERRRGQYYGRCELRAGHEGDHALERGMDVPRWSTDWTGA